MLLKADLAPQTALTPDDLIEAQLQRLAAVLEQARRQRKTLTYLQAAEAIHLRPPYRIHQLTELLERLMEQDAEAGRPLRAALVISRARAGLPADGFFDKAKLLGVFDGVEFTRFHQACLARVFQSNT